MKIEFLRGAAEDLIEAVEYYEMRQRGLGRDFAAEVQRVAATLLELPTLGERLDRIHRRTQLKRFPYGLIVRLEGGVIRVVAVRIAGGEHATGVFGFKSARKQPDASRIFRPQRIHLRHIQLRLDLMERVVPDLIPRPHLQQRLTLRDHDSRA